MIDVDLIAGQNLILHATGYRSRSDYLAGTNRFVTVYFYDSGGTEISSSGITLDASEFMHSQTKVIPVPSGTAKINLFRNGIVRHISLCKAGISLPDDKVSLGNNGIACKNLSLSPFSGQPFDPDSYARAKISNSNLFQLDLPQQQGGNVDWADRTLTLNSDRSIFYTTSSVGLSTGYVDIDPTRPYFVGIWCRVLDKKQGNISFGVTLNNGTTDVLGKAGSTGLEVSNPAFSSPNFNELANCKNRWILLHGYLVPDDWSSEKVTEFMETNRHFFGCWDLIASDVSLDDRNNGIGHSNEGNTGTVLQMTANTSRLKLNMGDYSNSSTNIGQSHWAMPIIIPIISAAWDDKSMFTPSISII